MEKWSCYIEEYSSAKGLSARLRDKATDKKISIQICSVEGKKHFLEFLSAAKRNQIIMPTIFNRDGSDIIAVYGIKQGENADTIFVDTDCENGGYLFE